MQFAMSVLKTSGVLRPNCRAMNVPCDARQHPFLANAHNIDNIRIFGASRRPTRQVMTKRGVKERNPMRV